MSEIFSNSDICQNIQKTLNGIVRIILILAFFRNIAFAQVPVRMGTATAEEIAAAKGVVEGNFDSVKAHNAYIYALGLNNPLLVDEYDRWIQNNPKNKIIPLSIGTAYYNAEMPQARKFLLAASRLDSNNAKIWFMLSGDAWMRGETDLSKEYLHKAALADSLNTDYAAYELMSSQDIKDSIYERKVIDFVKRFPDNGNGAKLLYSLAVHSMNVSDKVNYFEQLRKYYPPKKFDRSAAGMVMLADIYLQTDLIKAADLINEMGEKGDWGVRKLLVQGLIRIDSLSKVQDYGQVNTALQKLQLPGFNYLENFLALKKSYFWDKAGEVRRAYDSLIVVYAKLPTDQVYSALETYGNKIGKDRHRLDSDISIIRNESAVAAYPFELARYSGSGNLRLGDLKGKVVLLTFWYPGCNPCRSEFPYFEAVINKVKDNNLVYIGVNVVPEQDAIVPAIIKNNKYSFIPLRGTSAFADKYYGVKGVPENFLIDKSGRIIFKKFRINETNQRTLELMVTSLLGRNG
ncbi:thiol-disulfide isomerase/thioredoxin [Chitinophaga polysaccharea]|uniref:Thiol-disulfide isomerase/thioredoxin n=1 Tax=Chitinophaga polysaccharea TaxID=1293035 RepID=A0A561PRA3_9BACT|nr:TlpA disulfide reductase family protein [Chitinophaga polysaccharea]TWF40656.1 thiol-disulfide isomerase/thioredoxin [Chitinophaga polysaccharea]